jgi:carboxymethylenebutenolidase
MSTHATRTPVRIALIGLILLLAAHDARPQPGPIQDHAVEYPGSEGEMPAHLYSPPGNGRFPGLLVLHTSAGPGPNVEAFARRLASLGYVTMTPDLFSLHEFGAEGRTDHPLVLTDLAGALDFLKARPEVDPARIGVVGFSFGGRLAILAVAAHPSLRAAVVYYAVADHRELARTRPVGERALTVRPLTELAPRVHVPVLIHHGEADRVVPLEQGRLLHAALRAAGKESTLYTYPGADHLFNFSLGAETAHHPEADRLSWERTAEFLKRHL